MTVARSLLLGLMIATNTWSGASMAMDDLSMVLHNFGATFVTEQLAVQLARIIICEKYPQDIFVAAGTPVTADNGDAWSLTFVNSLSSTGLNVLPKTLTIRIRKADAAVLSIK